MGNMNRCRYLCPYTDEVIEGDTPLAARRAWTKHLRALNKIWPLKVEED